MTSAKYQKFLKAAPENVVPKDHHQELTNRIISMMEDSHKYEKPWFSLGDRPYNPSTGTIYSGINYFTLMMSGFSDPRWFTYKNIQDLAKETGTNIHLRKNEKGIAIFKSIQRAFVKKDKETEEENTVKYWTPVYSGTVFNASQIENLPPLPIPERKPFEDFEPAEKLVEAMIHQEGIKVIHHQGGAYYMPRNDSVHMPEKALFTSNLHYYRTLLHEFTHATGHSSRLDRDLTGSFGSESYAKEELVAELGSYLLGQDLNIGYDASVHENHSAYLQNWIKALKEDKTFIFKCVGKASRAVEYQLNAKRTYFNEPIENSQPTENSAEDSSVAPAKLKVA